MLSQLLRSPVATLGPIDRGPPQAFWVDANLPLLVRLLVRLRSDGNGERRAFGPNAHRISPHGVHHENSGEDPYGASANPTMGERVQISRCQLTTSQGGDLDDFRRETNAILPLVIFD